jgi:hypothetical protein
MPGIFRVRNLHYCATLALLLALIPSFHVAHLPLRFAWSSFFLVYWWSLAVQSIAAAIVLYAIGFPRELWAKLTSPAGPRENPLKLLAAVFLPAAYLFAMFILVFSYNDVIAVLRFRGTADLALNRIDARLLGGLTVSQMAHGISPRAGRVFEGIYFAMFAMLGACLILLALRAGRSVALQFVGAIATAYYLALIAFYFIPATGPFYLSILAHDGNYVGQGQIAFAQALNSIRAGVAPQIIGTDYFIAFPCLHITQPIIAIWMTRKWKPIAIALSIFTALLIPAILLTQQHYVIDLLGGLLFAAVAISVASH